MKLISLIKSRRFWMAVAAVVTALANDVLGIGLDEKTIQYVVLAIAAWILGDSLQKTL